MMRATFWYDFFVLCYHLIALDSLAQKINGGDVYVQQETSWQQGREQFTKLESWLALQRYLPVMGLKRRQEATFSLDQGLSNNKKETQDAVQIDNTGLNMISANIIEDCQPLPRLRARGRKEERAPPPVPNLKCPLPAITGTDTPQPGQQQPSSTTGHDEQKDGQAPSGTETEQPFILPDLFRIPINDGDNPTCYDATYGLMPVGVCQNPQQTPQPSKYDVFMNRNIDIYARAWKLIDSQPGSCSLFFFTST